MLRKRVAVLCILLTGLVLFPAISGHTAEGGVTDTHLNHSNQANRLTAPSYSNTNPVTLTSDDGKYRVTLHSTVSPLPLQMIHSWLAHIETPDGKPVDNAKVYVHGGMPMHRHGFPTRPRAKRHVGNGNYILEGIKFSMTGRWEIRLNIREKTRRDRVAFMIDL